MAATRVLLVSSRTDISDLLHDDPGADQYDLERRGHDFLDVEEAAGEFPVVLIDLDTTPDGVSLAKSLRAARRDLEFISIASGDRERQAVESLKIGAFDYLLWPPNEASDLFSTVARCLKKVAPPAEAEFPRAFGRFKLLRKLGSGGMAEVFLAESPATRTSPATACVVKAMHPHLALDEEFVRMFMDECRISTLLVHPNIVRVADFGRHGAIPYLVMEYVQGRNLEELRRDANAPFPQGLACWIVAEICAGLSHAHAKTDANGAPLGIVHRDVNPPNVLVSEEGRVMLTDFGIAKAAHRYHETTSGVLKGKFEYMAPEQAHGHPVDGRADLFCAGLILYELLTATRPFLAPTPIETLFLIQDCNPKPPSTHEAGIPPALDAIVMKALAREPKERYASAVDMERDLREFARRSSNPTARDLAGFARAVASRGERTDGYASPVATEAAPAAPPPFARPTVLRARPEPTLIGPKSAPPPATSTTDTVTPRPEPEPTRSTTGEATPLSPPPKDEATAIGAAPLLPIVPRPPNESTVSTSLFPGEVVAAEARRRYLRVGAIAGGVVLAAAIAVPIARTITREPPKPYGTPIVAATGTPETAPTPQSVEDETPLAVATDEAPPRPTPETSPLTVATVAFVATPRPTTTPRASPTAPVAAASPRAAPAQKGTLSIWVNGWAVVEIDGKPTGLNAPFVGHPLSAGKHVVTLHNQWVRKDVNVTILPGKETKLSVELR